jgi:SAM-dependent methyltransferase
VLNLDASDPAVTLVGDLGDPETLPERAFDCAVITQTLHYIYDMHGAIRNLRNSLKPNGTLLLTSPGISPIGIDWWRDSWYWSITPAGARRLFEEAFGEGNFDVDFYGNVFAAIAFLTGAAVEEVRRDKLEVKDDAYPIVVAVRATRVD